MSEVKQVKNVWSTQQSAQKGLGSCVRITDAPECSPVDVAWSKSWTATAKIPDADFQRSAVDGDSKSVQSESPVANSAFAASTTHADWFHNRLWISKILAGANATASACERASANAILPRRKCASTHSVLPEQRAAATGRVFSPAIPQHVLPNAICANTKQFASLLSPSHSPVHVRRPRS